MLQTHPFLAQLLSSSVDALRKEDLQLSGFSQCSLRSAPFCKGFQIRSTVR